MTIYDWQIAGAPLAVIDVETTGLVPGRDRIIEVAVIHLDSDRPTTALDTLINPLRPVANNVHGLCATDLAEAPVFSEVAGDLLRAISSRILVAHNAYFDIRMLTEELALCGYHQIHLPFLCTMSLRPALQLGPKQRLSELCAAFGIDYKGHSAHEDALAVSCLMTTFREETKRLGLRNFSDLAHRMPPACTASWSYFPLPEVQVATLPKCRKLLPRTTDQIPPSTQQVNYGQAVLEALSDYELSDAELANLKQLQATLALPPERIRAFHACVFTWFLSRAGVDMWVDSIEMSTISRIRDYLSNLGWAPGDPPYGHEYQSESIVVAGDEASIELF